MSSMTQRCPRTERRKEEERVRVRKRPFWWPKRIDARNADGRGDMAKMVLPTRVGAFLEQSIFKLIKVRCLISLRRLFSLFFLLFFLASFFFF
jgi:hypothetical protein